jgi:hypothetical protein
MRRNANGSFIVSKAVEKKQRATCLLGHRPKNGDLAFRAKFSG